MKCNFRKNVDNGLIKSHIIDTCLLKDMGNGIEECDGEENCLLCKILEGTKR